MIDDFSIGLCVGWIIGILAGAGIVSSADDGDAEAWCRHAHKDVASYEQCLEKPDYPWLKEGE